MSNLYHMEEYRIKRDIKEVEEAINTARAMVAKGVPVPPATFKRLEDMRNFLENKLIAFIENEEEQL